MTDHQKPKTLTPEEKQYTVLPNEAEPNTSMTKAIAAALKAKGKTQKIHKPR
ncbi:hypothetical protein ACJJIW_21835 [Microbulbifer sp. JMSA004]|uniref:hypothetical protein n=1 Tax=Microbulbifer sp. JMSA004 TaxID=3243370 RepID=UPI004039C5B3